MSDIPPRLILATGFVGRLTSLLQKDIAVFTKEEGGYLIGRYNEDGILIDTYYHDVAAQRSMGDIHLSSGAFEEACRLAEKTGGTVVGTWHLHPPGFPAAPSSLDVDSLFVDRMVLNATDPGRYERPWAHVIVPGLDAYQLKAYALFIPQDFGCRPKTKRGARLSDLVIPKDRRVGLLVYSKRFNKMRLYPFSARVFYAALRSRRLEGIWHLWQSGTPYVSWERVFLENFSRKINANQPTIGGGTRKEFEYWRIMIGKKRAMCLVQECVFSLPENDSKEQFIPLTTVFPDRQVPVRVENPNLDSESYEISTTPQTTAGDLMRQIMIRANLKNSPVLWTLLSTAATKHYRGKTRVEEDGKVYLPEEVLIHEILPRRLTDEVPLYWETPELSSETVLNLRTQRFRDMGYDIDRLRLRHVVIAGVGLLGCGVAQLLGTMSVGRLTLIDRGTVDWVNIYRQSLYEPADVGQPKVIAAACHLEQMGISCRTMQIEVPSVLIPDVDQAAMNLISLSELIRSADIVVGALDAFSSRAVLQVICRIHAVPFLAVALDYLPELHLTQGTIAAFNRKGGQCYGCGSNLKMQKDRGACTSAPLEFPGIVSSLAAGIAVDILQAKRQFQPRSCRVYGDFRVEIKKLGPAADKCDVCSLAREAQQQGTSDWVRSLISWLIC
jgi:adenylyltransferase/sulfurtransferase